MIFKRLWKRHASLQSSRGLLDPHKVLLDVGLKRGDTLLDAGCGDGYFALAASEMVGPEGAVHAVDLSPGAITLLKQEVARKHIGNVDVLLLDITSGIPLASDSVDMVVLVSVLHGFVTNKEVDDLLRELKRVLKTGGILSVVDFRKTKPPPGPVMSLRLAPEEVVTIISPYHFRKERIFEAGAYHYAVTFRT